MTSLRDGSLFATGQMGHRAIVVVWDPSTQKTIQVLPDLQSGSITALSFSTDGILLAVSSLDEDHTISVYNWKSSILISRSFGGSGRVLCLGFSENSETLLSCGVKFIKLWDVRTRYMTCIKPALGELGELQSFLCSTYFSGFPVIGSADGNLFVLSASGDALSKNIKAHDGEICSLYTSNNNDQLASGGKDGTIRIWNQNFDCLREIPLESILSYRGPKIRSIQFSLDDNVLLVGTRGSEILEVNVRSGTMINSEPLLQGHGHRDLWGLSTPPKKDEFVTSGDDGTLRFWDTKNFRMIRKINVDASSRAVAYSADGALLAVGFGSGNRSRSKSTSKDGAFIVLNSADTKIVHEGKDSNEPIRVVKFSNDGKFLAIGSEDSKIYLYNVKDKYSRRAIVASHKAPVLHLDFTTDSQFLMSVDSTNRIFYTETSSGVNVAAAAALRDEKWASWSCPVGWPVQGFWKSQPQGTFPSCVQKSWNGMLLACANTCGRIFISHNPCIDESGFVDNTGHAGNISRICWSTGDTYLLTIGSIDHTVMQWKCVYDTARESGEEGGLSCEDSDIERIGGHEAIIVTSSTENITTNPQWLTNIAPPSDLRDDDVSIPTVNYLPDVLHGPRVSDCRQTLMYNADGNILMASSSCCVVYDRDKHVQMINDRSAGTILCVDVDPSGKVGASGTRGRNPELQLWDARTSKQLGMHCGIHKNGITSVKFSPCSEFLITLGQDQMNSIVLLRSTSKRWHDSFIVASCGVSFFKMFWVLYAGGNEYPIVVGGNRCLFFFRVSGTSMERAKGVFGRRRKLQAVLCGTVSTEKTNSGLGSTPILTGTVTGHVYRWVENRVQSAISASDDTPVTCITTCQRGFITGGKDGVVKIWSHEMRLLHEYNANKFAPPPQNSSCHSLRMNSRNSRLLIGVRSGEAYEVTMDTDSRSLLFVGHGYGELQGLDLNPQNDDEFVTAGDDGCVRIWSFSEKRCLRHEIIGSPTRAIAWDPTGSNIVVGIGGDPKNTAKDGAFCVLDSLTLQNKYEDRKAKQWITDVKFGKDIFVVMSRDGCAYIHDSEKFSFIRKIETPNKSNAGIIGGDFNSDFEYIRFGTTKQDLFYYKTDGELITSPITLRNFEWHTHTCIYNWMSRGTK